MRCQPAAWPCHLILSEETGSDQAGATARYWTLWAHPAPCRCVNSWLLVRGLSHAAPVPPASPASRAVASLPFPPSPLPSALSLLLAHLIPRESHLTTALGLP